MQSKITFTSSLSVKLLGELEKYAQKLKKNKNQLIEVALKRYFDELKRIEYSYSFKRASHDEEVVNMVEEGLADYIKMLEENEK